MGSVQFRIAPCSSLHFTISIGPFHVVGVIYRDFNLFHWSLLKWFPLFIWLLFVSLCLISALTQAGRGGLLFRVACSIVLRGGRGAADRYCCVWGALAVFRPQWVCPRSQVSVLSRLHCSGSWMLYMERALRCVRFQFSGPPQKRGLGCACVLCLPRPEWLRQPGA